MTITHQDGNVIHADFGTIPQPNVAVNDSNTRNRPLLGCSVSCDLLYCDSLLAVTRLTYRVNGQEFIQHIITDGTKDEQDTPVPPQIPA